MSKNHEVTQESKPGRDVATRAVRNQIREGVPDASVLYPFLRAPIQEDEIGRLGDYRVLSLLGSGGMGMVFLAEDIALRRRIALKVMKPDLNQGSSAWERFLREAQIMAAIKHENLVTVYQVGQDGSAVYLAMELLDGESLESWIQHVGKAETADILYVAREVAVGLSAIHQQGAIHRDIKPANIWLERRTQATDTRLQKKGAPEGKSTNVDFALNQGGNTLSDERVKILDFGLARAVDDTSITRSGMIVGTPAYMSPEQARGKPLGARSDLFSLGCVMYAMSTGSEPFKADSTMAQLAALVADKPKPVSKVNPKIPEPLADLIMELLAKEPEERPQSAQDVIDRLRKIKRQLSNRKKKTDDRTQKLERRQVEKSVSKKARQEKDQTKLAMIIGGSVFGGIVLLTILVFILAGVFAPPRPAEKGPDPGGPIVGPVDGPKNGGPVELPPLAANRTYLAKLPPVNPTSWPWSPPPPNKSKGPKDVGPRDKGADIGPLSVSGKPAQNGIFMHAAPPFEPTASVSFRLDKKYRTFHTGVGFNDSADFFQNTVTFAVYGDGKLLWKSRAFTDRQDAQECSVPVHDVALLKLEVSASEPEVRGTHGVWIDPYVD